MSVLQFSAEIQSVSEHKVRALLKPGMDGRSEFQHMVEQKWQIHQVTRSLAVRHPNPEHYVAGPGTLLGNSDRELQKTANYNRTKIG